MRTILQTFLIAGISCFSLSVQALSELHIKAGETFMVTPKLAKLDLESFIVESKAVIKVDPSIDVWIVSARNAKVGDGVQILGSGLGGKNGTSGRSHTDAKRCDIGHHGSNGRNGSNGTNAANVIWSLGVANFGSVSVNLTGGNGGNGGNGGDGQNIPHLKGCGAPAGDAGNGGNGGDGGDGGSFTFHYWLVDGASDVAGNSIGVRFNAGRSGKGGAPGFPGVGSPGQTSNSQWVAGGEDGAEGVVGSTGSVGRTGALEIRKVADESGAEIVVEVPEEEPMPESAEERIHALEITVQKLEARIKLLELDKQ